MTTSLPRRSFVAAAAMPLAAAALSRLAFGQSQPPPGGDVLRGRQPALGRPTVATPSPASRIISYYLIGGSSPDDATRRVGVLRPETGWTGFINQQIKPAYEWGARRFWLHWPFGIRNLTETTEWDAYLDAKYGGFNWLTDDFVEKWKPIREGSLGSPVDMTGYIGRCFGDPEFAALRQQEKRAEWLVRAIASVVPLLQCDFNIGVDASASIPEGEPDLALCELLASLGTRMFIETRPQKNLPRWKQFNVIVDAAFWYRSDPGAHADAEWAVPNDELRGEVVRAQCSLFPGKTWDDISWQVEEARKALADGHTVLINVNHFAAKGVTLNDLVAGL